MTEHTELSLDDLIKQTLLDKLLGDKSNGFPTKGEAYQAAFRAGITNPGVITKNNEFFFTDPNTTLPEGTFGSENEARQFASSIGRADLVPVLDSATGRFRLEEPPQSTPTGTRWIPEIGKFEVTLTDGRVQLVDPAQFGAGTEAAPFGSTAIPGTDFVLVNDGQGGTSIVAKSQADIAEDQPRGEIVTMPDGRQFIQQPNGTLVPLGPAPVPSLDQMISKALLAGDIDGAIALSDFRDRPSSMELFQAALDFAQSPGDTAAISAIARGQTLVEPGPPGSVQRIAAQPEFLRDQFQKLMGRFRDGGGTPNDIVSALQDASNRMREDQEARSDAEQALADRDAADSEKELQGLLDRIDALENPPESKEGGPTTFSGTPLGPGPGGTQLDEGAALFRLFSDAAAREPRFEEPISSPAQGAPAPFVSEESQEVIDNPGFTAATPERVAELEAIQAPVPTRATSGFFTGLNAAGEDDFFAHGGVFDDSTAIVGENGPELLIARPGSRVIPLEEDDLAMLKKRVRGLQEGGFVPAGQSPNELIWAAAIAATPPELRPEDPFNRALTPPTSIVAPTITTVPTPVVGTPIDPSSPAPDANLPFGVRQALRGGSIEPTRRRLSTAAGIPVLSAQARQRLLPEELAVLDRLRAEAGIPLGAFQQEQRSAVPGARRRGASRFAARVVR